MPIHLSNRNIVIVAHHFNPSVLSQLWLVRNGIVDEAAFTDGCVYGDVVSQTVTAEFDLTVVPQQLQFAPKIEGNGETSLVQVKIGTVAKTLPHTPFRALGMNFTWNVLPINALDDTLNRRLFFREDRALYSEFSTPDAFFGAYLSKNIFGCRLKLDIKPNTIAIASAGDPSVPSAIQALIFSFNFHLDLNVNDPVNGIVSALEYWSQAKAESERLTRLCVEKEAV